MSSEEMDAAADDASTSAGWTDAEVTPVDDSKVVDAADAGDQVLYFIGDTASSNIMNPPSPSAVLADKKAEKLTSSFIRTNVLEKIQKAIVLKQASIVTPMASGGDTFTDEIVYCPGPTTGTVTAGGSYSFSYSESGETPVYDNANIVLTAVFDGCDLGSAYGNLVVWGTLKFTFTNSVNFSFNDDQALVTYSFSYSDSMYSGLAISDGTNQFKLSFYQNYNETDNGTSNYAGTLFSGTYTRSFDAGINEYSCSDSILLEYDQDTSADVSLTCNFQK